MSKITAKLSRFLKIFGPGVITGAADDDPSGIATYTQTGAKFGYGQLWTVIVMLPAHDSYSGGLRTDWRRNGSWFGGCN